MQRLLEAVSIAYSGGDNALRSEAERFLTQYKAEKGKGVVGDAFSLVTGQVSKEVYARHFGYHLLEGAIEKHWAEYSSEEVGHWKQTLLGLTLVEELPLLQQKLSHLIGLLALRTWPQHWQDLMPSLGVLWDKGPRQREMATRCFLALSEEVAVHAYIQTAPHEKGASALSGRWDQMQIAANRKQEVLKAFEEHSPGILMLINRYLMEDFGSIMREESLNTQVGLSVQLLNKLCLNVPLGAMISNDATGWVRLITHPAASMQVADILKDLFESLSIPADSAKGGNDVPLRFIDDIMKHLCKYLQGDCRLLGSGECDVSVEDLDFPEEVTMTHRFSVKVSDVMLCIAKNDGVFSQLCAIPECRTTITHVAAQLVTHPSAVVHLNGLTFLKRMMNNTDMVAELIRLGDDFFTPVHTYINRMLLTKPTTLRQAVINAKKLNSKDVDPNGHLDSMTSVFLVIEFEEQEEEIMLHHAHLTSAHREVAQLLNKAYPQGFLRFFVDRMSFILTNVQEFLPSANLPRSATTGNITHDTKLYLHWVATETSVMHFVDSLPDGLFSNPAFDSLFARLGEILTAYISIRIDDGIVLARYLGVLQCIATLLIRKHIARGGPPTGCQPLSTVVSKLVSQMGHRLAHETGPIMSLDTISCRRKVQTVLLNLSLTFAACLADQLPLLLKAWKEYQDNMTLTDQEVSLLTESITTIANTLPDEERGGVLYKIVDPLIAPWDSLNQFYSDRDLFRRFIETIMDPRGAHPDLDKARGTLRKCISVFQGVFRRAATAKDPREAGANGAAAAAQQGSSTLESLATLSRRLLPGILQLIAALHWVWSPGVMSGGAVALLTITSEEKEQSTGGNVTRSSDLILKGDTLTPSQKIFVGRQYVCQLRASAYALLGSLTSFNLGGYAEFQRYAMTIFNADLQHIEILQLKYFFNDFCVPFLLLTPRDHHQVMSQVMSQLASFLYNRLNGAWAAYQTRYASQRGVSATFSHKEGAKVTTDDAWEFKLLTDLTGEIAAVFFHVSNIGHGSLVGNTRLKKYTRDANEVRIVTETCVEMARTDAMIVSILQLLTGAVIWPSTVSSVRAVEALLKLVPSIAARPTLAQPLCHLLGCSLHRIASLQQQVSSGNRDSQLVNYLINLVCEVYPVLCLVSSEPGKMLVQMGIAAQDVVELEKLLRQEKAVGKRRGRFKVLLNPKRDAGQAHKIGNLPQYDFLKRATTLQPNSEADEIACTAAFQSMQ